MPDVFTKAKRSHVMSRIRGRGNKSTELALAKLFRAHGLAGWRRHEPVFGKPDFVFRMAHIAVFVDGCFWHGCPKHATLPAARRKFWLRKFADNKARDRRVSVTLRKQGWRVIRVWEHDLKSKPSRVVRKVLKALNATS